MFKTSPSDVANRRMGHWISVMTLALLVVIVVGASGCCATDPDPSPLFQKSLQASVESRSPERQHIRSGDFFIS